MSCFLNRLQGGKKIKKKKNRLQGRILPASSSFWGLPASLGLWPHTSSLCLHLHVASFLCLCLSSSECRLRFLYLLQVGVEMPFSEPPPKKTLVSVLRAHLKGRSFHMVSFSSSVWTAEVSQHIMKSPMKIMPSMSKSRISIINTSFNDMEINTN